MLRAAWIQIAALMIGAQSRVGLNGLLLVDAHRSGAGVDEGRLAEAALAELADPYPVGLATLELPALVGGAHDRAAVAGPLAGEVHQRDDRAAELIGDLPAVA